MAEGPRLADLPALPWTAEEGPVFRAPWEARAFAITIELYERGHFTWREWVSCLAAEIAKAQRRGDPDLGNTYYRHWLAALEKIAARKGLALAADLAARREEWRNAAAQTEFGKPIELRHAGPRDRREQ